MKKAKERKPGDVVDVPDDPTVNRTIAEMNGHKETIEFLSTRLGVVKKELHDKIEEIAPELDGWIYRYNYKTKKATIMHKD